MTQEINLVAILEIKEGSWSDLADAVHHCVEESRKEAGNHAYDAYFQKNHSNRIVFIERWENQQAIDYHCKTEHFQNLMRVTKKYAVKPLELLTLVSVPQKA